MKKILLLIYLMVPLLGVAQESRSTLKTYFETGDIPTQAQFESLIDSQWNLADDGDLDSTIVYDSLADHRTLLDAHVDSISDLRSDIGSGNYWSLSDDFSNLGSQTITFNGSYLRQIAPTGGPIFSYSNPIGSSGSSAIGVFGGSTVSDPGYVGLFSNASGITFTGIFVDLFSRSSVISDSGLVVVDGRATKLGLRYENDYSTGWSKDTWFNRSLTPKIYTDSHLTGYSLASPTISENSQSVRWNNGTSQWEYFSAAEAKQILILQRQIQVLKTIIYSCIFLALVYLVSKNLPKEIIKQSYMYKLKQMFNK